MIQICTKCGTAHNGAQALPGSGWIELVLWLCYIVPGLIYSIWRRGKARPVCASCGSTELVDARTPVGAELVRKYHPDGLGPLPAPPAPATTRPAFKVLGWCLLVLLLIGPVVSLLTRR